MALRQFADSAGVEWTVFDVIPRPNERRSQDRRDPSLPGDEPEDRRGDDRRATVGAIGGRITRGWLCFESSTERRRLQPIPDKWHVKSDAELSEMLGRARVAPRRTNPGHGAGAGRS